MSAFSLALRFRPSFHRPCSVLVVGDHHGGEAHCELMPVGLLARVVTGVAVDSDRMATLRGCCRSMLSGWDDRWRKFGLDGLTVTGSLVEDGA